MPRRYSYKNYSVLDPIKDLIRKEGRSSHYLSLSITQLSHSFPDTFRLLNIDLTDKKAYQPLQKHWLHYCKQIMSLQLYIPSSHSGNSQVGSPNDARSTTKENTDRGIVIFENNLVSMQSLCDALGMRDSFDLCNDLQERDAVLEQITHGGISAACAARRLNVHKTACTNLKLMKGQLDLIADSNVKDIELKIAALKEKLATGKEKQEFLKSEVSDFIGNLDAIVSHNTGVVASCMPGRASTNSTPSTPVPVHCRPSFNAPSASVPS